MRLTADSTRTLSLLAGCREGPRGAGRIASWRARLAAATAASVAVLLILACPTFAATGDLSQKPGPDGCITESFSGCAKGKALSDPRAMTVSPDGKSVYITGYAGVGVLNRDVGTGRLTQNPGLDACFGIGAGFCTPVPTLLDPQSAAVSPDGKSVYVAARYPGTITVLDRDPGTGALTPNASPDGCIGNFPGCQRTVSGSLEGAESVAVSPDGKSVYAVSSAPVAPSLVMEFDRDPATGGLTQKAGTDGCISDGDPNCTLATWLRRAQSLTVSPDGKNVYVAAADGVAELHRDTDTGTLTQSRWIDGCISSDVGCTAGRSLRGAQSIAVSPDGKSVYVAALFYPDSGVAVLNRDSATGALTQNSGAAGCMNGYEQGCTPAKALQDAQAVAVSPDGKSVYVVSPRSNALAAFDRDTSTGSLTQKAGPAGCIANLLGCTPAIAFGDPQQVAVSPDGKSVYVTSRSFSGVTVFDRQPAPISRIGSGPRAASNDPTATFTFSSDTSGSSFQCEVDLGAWAACASPLTTSTLADGLHSFRVRAVDTAGNIGAPASYGFATDTARPNATITAGPQGLTNGSSPRFAFSASKAGSRFECRLDSGAFAPCSSPWALARVVEGPHTFAVRAIDQLGNTSLIPATRSFTVDTTVAGTARAKKTQKQKRNAKKISLSVNLTAHENLAAAVIGTVRVGTRSYKLKATKARVAAGRRTILTLAVQRRSDAKRIVTAIQRGNMAQARLTVLLTDTAGNSSTITLAVRLKR